MPAGFQLSDPVHKSGLNDLFINYTYHEIKMGNSFFFYCNIVVFILNYLSVRIITIIIF